MVTISNTSQTFTNHVKFFEHKIASFLGKTVAKYIGEFTSSHLQNSMRSDELKQ